MKLQKQLSRKTKDKEYAKYVVVIPPKAVEELGWKNGDELEAEISNKRIILNKK